jgi:septal ring factor EnvC (AmiA/AmiB activator)
MSFFQDIATLANPKTGVPALVKELPDTTAADSALVKSNNATQLKLAGFATMLNDLGAKIDTLQASVDKLQATLDKMDQNPPDTTPPADPGQITGRFVQE